MNEANQSTRSKEAQGNQAGEGQPKGGTAEPQSKDRGWRDTLRRFAALAFVLLFSVGLLVVGLYPLAAYLRAEDSRAVAQTKAVRPGGRVVSVRLTGGLFSRGWVETDQAFYSLAEGVSLGKGEAVTVEERAGHQRFLCDARHFCTALLQPLEQAPERAPEPVPNARPAVRD